MSKKNTNQYEGLRKEVRTEVVISFDTTGLNAKDRTKLADFVDDFQKKFKLREEIIAKLTAINFDLAFLDVEIGALHAKADKNKAKKNNMPCVDADDIALTKTKKQIKADKKAEKKAAKSAKKEAKADHPAKA